MVLRSVSMGRSCAVASESVTTARTKSGLGLICIHSSQIVFEESGGQKARDERASCDHQSVLPLPNFAHEIRPTLNVRGSRSAKCFVARERIDDGCFSRDTFC